MNRTYPVDLQTHTTFSDGTDTPEELFRCSVNRRA